MPELTPDEIAVLQTLATGVTDEVAAARLGWSPRTLRRRLRSAMDKLGAESRFQAGCVATRGGWVQVESALSRERT